MSNQTHHAMSKQTTQASPPAGVRTYLDQLMEERRIPGLQVAVVRDGSIVLHEVLGLADLEHRVPATRESIFSINSMAKAFTGVALMQLVEAGQLDLAAPVSRYLDGLPESWRLVTVRQLATLTSGLPEITSWNADGTVGLIGGGDERAAWAATYALPMEFAPGEGYRYVQTNYALLGKIIDRLSGKPFTEFIAERQFAVVGMSHTLYADDRDIIPNRATTYTCLDSSGVRLNDPNRNPTEILYKSHYDWPPILRTAAGLHSTAEDLARWIIALQRGSLIQRASTLETLWTANPLHDGRPGAWGIGWLIGKSAKGARGCPGRGRQGSDRTVPGRPRGDPADQPDRRLRGATVCPDG